MTIADIDWPGPRPLAFDDASTGAASLRRLVGRQRELNELLDACQTYAVIEITAASGVGKTSFVAGARPHLEQAGATVIRARSWSETLGEFDELAAGATESSDSVALYCLAFAQPVRSDARELPGMLATLTDGRPLVCIVDQLEELIRYRRTLGKELLELIGQTAAASGVSHVVIARSEYRNDLKPVEVARAPTWHMLLPEISDPAVIADIVKQPIPADVKADEEFVDRIVDLWVAARSSSTHRMAAPDPVHLTVHECGLLHLQALLWSFKRWAMDAPDLDLTHLTLASLERYAADRGMDCSVDAGNALMADALYAYVEETVAGCHSDRWPYGPRLMLARAVRHLSSTGFKVAQPTSALVSRAMQEELGSLRPTTEGEAQLGASSHRDGRQAKARAFVRQVPIEGAGLAEGWEPWEVAAQMIASLEDALEALSDDRDANILRKYQHGSDPVFELVHDGIAPALNEWADRQLGGAHATIGGISARRGEVFEHNLTAQMFVVDGTVDRSWGAVETESVDGGTKVVLKHLRWRGLGVHSVNPSSEGPRVTFERVVFRDCLFQGTLFLDMTLREITFDNCDMTGIALIACELHDVEFKGCVLHGAAIKACTMNGVRFDGHGEPGLLDGISVEHTSPGARVKFRNLDTTGLFLVGLQGGSWTFEDVDLRHLVFNSPHEEDVVLRVGGNSTIRHATVTAPRASTTCDFDSGVKVGPLTDENGVIPPHVIDDGSGGR
jgi:conflict system STAND superfamily ATPase/pentapeptide repeat protein